MIIVNYRISAKSSVVRIVMNRVDIGVVGHIEC